MSTLRLGVLASGRGSNLQSIMDAAAAGKIGAKVAVVISDKEDAFALERARLAGIPAKYVSFGDYASKDDYERAILDILKQNDVDLVCLAGYMRLVGRIILEAYNNRIMNIHPALLPSFPGLHGQEQAWEYGGIAAVPPFVDNGMDTGPIIIQVVPYDEDTVDSAARSWKEHNSPGSYPAGLRGV